MSTYFKVYRGWRDNPVFKGEFSRGDAWIWLIENASWKEQRVRIKGDTITLERGELSFSQRFMAEKWGWSKSRVDRFIADLRDEGMIETRAKIGATDGHIAGQGQSIISICNYDKYQGEPDGLRGNDLDTSGATAGQQRGNSGAKNKKERKKEDNSNELSFVSETEIEPDDFDNPPPAKPSTDEVEQAVEIWNKAAAHSSWPEIRKLNPDRRKKLAARLSEIGGVIEWRAVLVRATKGMLGAQPPPTWFSFDWITTNQTNILKVIEGNYDRKFEGNRNGTTTRSERNADLIQQAIDHANELAAREGAANEPVGFLALTDARPSPH